ncbi:TetR/AcrR family transcriptional regulator [uncultured Salinisphaera sp.]|uniref:TetR/AcrR family transcriptional regulator n=2 Tax=Salinisphaera TaxID=180541 RepID=UPI0032B17B49|tara:strand:+ start:2192 stop:2866 length:675 start_codon:yes stop_codon:yes gene_type:complete
MSDASLQASTAAGRDYAGQSLDERRAQRRQALIDAGEVIFGDQGFRAATVKAICRQAGLTERYFYESFSNSEALFAAVYKTLVAAIEQDMRSALAAAPTDADAMADAALRVYFSYMARPRVARIVLIEIFGISPSIDRTYRAATLKFAELTEELTGRLFDASLLDGQGARSRLVAMGLVGSTIHIAMYWNLNGYRESLDEVVGSALALYRAMAASMDAAAADKS